MKPKNHPGVYIPPPLIYAVFFFLSIGIDKMTPIGNTGLHSTTVRIAGWILISFCVLVIFMAIRKFVISKNTLITIKPALSLQTTGIYAYSRNPMYMGLLLLYTGLSVIIGNWWNFILLPILLLVVQEYVIKREEKYLGLRFGQQYFDYKAKVRRWL
ncbi:MAG: isoprenylcysteine carboxylmethyltransferase family protein [Bacteroidetes bacterium]|nr:isoprenylcysteine carboxylmethyltransferase family protein [Bacteroidota bacterium]